MFVCECPDANCQSGIDKKVWLPARERAAELDSTKRLSIVRPDHVGDGRVAASGDGYAIVEFTEGGE
jgi:hypothetical protein